ncbi:MAG: hypothetical protein JO222_09325 [Frankiales bacterium]|nr:hypothetical protein [Frankiales bacterium]
MHRTLALVGLIAALAVVLNFFGMIAAGGRVADTAGRLGFRARVLLLGGDAGVVTLAQSALFSATDLDTMVIDEFVKNQWLLRNLPFHDAVNPVGAGGTLTYAYNRQITQSGAGFRAINAEYTPGEATVQQYVVNLRPLGGSFQIDRVLDGVAAGAETAFQLQQKVKASAAAFMDAAINGDVSVDANGFDGLNKALTGSSTEVNAAVATDWTSIAFGNDTAFAALDVVDTLLSYLNGPPTAILGNKALLAKLRGIMRRTGAYTRDIYTFNDGTTNFVEQYGNILLIDPGTKAGSNTDIIPVTHKNADAIVSGSAAGNYTDMYVVRLGLDGFHGVSMAGRPLVNTWLPDFVHAGAVKTGEVELGPVSVALKATKAAAVYRNIRVS